MKKPITELTNEELIDLLNQAPETNELFIEYPNDILDFISTFQIKNGENSITSRLLYKLYRKWSQDPVTLKIFSTSIADRFTTFNSLGRNSFKLNINENVILSHTLKYMKKRMKTKSPLWKKHFDNYLAKYKLEAGTFYLKDSILYNLYDKWTYKTNKRNPLSKNQFLNFCKLYFKYKKISRTYWFSVNKSVVEHLTEDHKKELLRKDRSEEETNKT